jgi:hypothetical protein
MKVEVVQHVIKPEERTFLQRQAVDRVKAIFREAYGRKLVVEEDRRTNIAEIPSDGNCRSA